MCTGKSADMEAWGCLFRSLMASFPTGNIQEVILQEHIGKEDEVLVSLAGLKQVGLVLFYARRCDASLQFFFLSVYRSDQRHS